MKKILLLLSVLLFTAAQVLAQVEKGKILLAGYSGMSLDLAKEKTKYGSTTHTDNSFSAFTFNPVAGYYLMDKLAAGLYFDTYFRRTKDLDDNEVDKESQFIAGPFVRYYFMQLEKLFPYAEARAGIGNYTETYSDGDKYKESAFSYRMGVGASYFFIENVAFDAFAGYDYDGYTDKDSDPKSKYYYTTVEINFGIVFTF